MTDLTYTGGKKVVCCFCHGILTMEDDTYQLEASKRKGWGDLKSMGSQYCHERCLPPNCQCLLKHGGFSEEEDAYFKSKEYEEYDKKHNICPDCHQRKYGNWRNCPTCAKALHMLEVEDEKRRHAEKRIMRDVARKKET